MIAEEVSIGKANINQSIRKLNKKHKQQLGFIGPYIGMLLIIFFAFALLPLYFFLVVFNRLYFWIRKQNKINPSLFFNFDRHKLPHLRFADKVWCEYCEWSNGCLQWALAITNEIERRYCPIQNKQHLKSEENKKWRDDFLAYDHEPEDIDLYYQNQYMQKR